MTAALLLFGAASASALAPGDTATISGSYSSYASTSSSDPNFAPCTALPAPSETFWAFVNGNEHISNTFSSGQGLCSFTSSPDPSQAGVTDYALTYTWGADWGIVINDSDVGKTLTLTMAFHTMDNIVATEVYQITAPTTTTDATSAATTTTTPTGTTATTTTAQTTTAPVTTAPTTAAPPPPGTTSTITVPSPSSTTSAPTTEAASTTTTTPAPPKPKAAVITTAATIHAPLTGGIVTVTIKTNSRLKSFLCYRRTPAGKTKCVAGYGTWSVHLPAARHSSVKRLFVIKVASATVAEKTITIRVA